VDRGALIASAGQLKTVVASRRTTQVSIFARIKMALNDQWQVRVTLEGRGSV